MSGAALVSAAALAGRAAAEPVKSPANAQAPAPAPIEPPQTIGPYPKWSEFPRGPQPTPPPSEIASRVASVQQAQADLLNTAAGLQWTLSGTAAFAAAARSEVNPEYATPAPADQAARIEEMAKALHEQATPPPPPTKPK